MRGQGPHHEPHAAGTFVSFSPARKVRLPQTSLRLSLGTRGQPGPLHWPKSCRGQMGNGAWGGRSCMGNGARAEGRLPAPSGEPTNRKGHGRVPSYGDKGRARGGWGCRRSPGREVRGGTAPGPPGTGRAPWQCPLQCRYPRGHTGTYGTGGAERKPELREGWD